jgi:DNA-directed RNA polymerase specialized sigma24 family protein
MAGYGVPRKLSPLEETGVYEAKINGTPIAEIAYKFGISVRTVDRIVKRVKNEIEERGGENESK